MDIIAYSEVLEKKLKGIITADQENLAFVGKTLSGIREIIAELKHFTASYHFVGVEEEVRFFKEVKPVFLSQYYFHKKKFEMQLSDSFSDHQSRIGHYKKVLAKLKKFSQRHHAFYEYCLSGSSYMDQQYFTRRQKDSIERDERFTTARDSVFAKILAGEMIREFVHSRLSQINPGPVTGSESSLQWTGAKVNLIEMIYALHAAGAFNHGRAELKQIVQGFESMLGVDLGNYARTFSEIKIRKSGQSNFLDHLRDRLLSIVVS